VVGGVVVVGSGVVGSVVVGSGMVSVTVGSRQDAMGACLVTRAVDGSFYRPIPDDVYFGNDEGEVLLTLNCNRGAATATVPGPFAASPAGREFTAKAEEAAAAAQSEEAELAEAGESPGVWNGGYRTPASVTIQGPPRPSCQR